MQKDDTTLKSMLFYIRKGNKLTSIQREINIDLYIKH